MVTPIEVDIAAPLQTVLTETKCALQWFVLRTRSRQEKAIAKTLDAAGIEYCLPMIERVRFYSHRKRTVLTPLFSSYVFLHGRREETFLATATKRVVQVIPVNNEKQFEHELRQIQDVLSRGGTLGPYQYLEVGRRVRVTAGPFKDIEGLIEDFSRANRLVLQIEALGRATSLEIDPSLLEPVDFER